MSVIPPQPGMRADILRVEVKLVIAGLRAQLALARHVLDQHQDPALSSVVSKLQSAIDDLGALPEPQAEPQG